MSILDKVKGLLVDVGIKANNIASNNKFTLFNYEDRRTQIIVREGGRVKGINLAALDEKKEKALKQIFQQANKGTLFASDESATLLQEVSSSIKKPNNIEILNFFSDKIPPDDYVILTASLVIRDKFKQGLKDQVSKLRSQLSSTYGEKANTISNLCTAIYFEEFLIPLYDEMKKSTTFVLEDYKRAYIKLINDFPVAIFINSHMSKKDVERKIRSKIVQNKQYSVPYLNIHGIGRDNIGAIQGVISKLRFNVDYTDIKVELDDPIIIVRLRFD